MPRSSELRRREQASGKDPGSAWPQSGMARLREQIMNKKVLDFLQEKARIQPAITQ
jgi:hypothetical protein